MVKRTEENVILAGTGGDWRLAGVGDPFINAEGNEHGKVVLGEYVNYGGSTWNSVTVSPAGLMEGLILSLSPEQLVAWPETVANSGAMNGEYTIQ